IDGTRRISAAIAASAHMALITLIYVTTMATSSSGLLGKWQKRQTGSLTKSPLPAPGKARLASPTLHNPFPQWGRGLGEGVRSVVRPTPNGPSCRRHANA